MHMRVGWAVLAAVLMDCENTLGASRGATESLLDGVPEDPFRKESIEPEEALGGRVVDGQDEAEVGGVFETASILAEGLADRRFVTSKGPISFTDSVKLTAPSIGQSLLPVRDVTAVVDALFEGEDGALNVPRALALLQSRRGDIVRVNDKDNMVRVWIDEK